MIKEKKKIFILTGEASGDLIGYQLVKSIKKLNRNVSFSGVSGDALSKVRGFKSIMNISSFSVMGFMEVLKNLRTIKKNRDEVIKKIEEINPDIFVSIDAPSLAKSIVKILKKRGKTKCPFIHYVAPQVWAWRKKRAKTYANIFDKILCFFDFEPPYFEKYGGSCKVVGHPSLEIVKGCRRSFFRKNPKLEGKTIITILPGSRKNEISKLMPYFKSTVEKLSKENKNIKFLIPTLSHTKSIISKEIKKWKVKPLIIPSDQETRFNAFKASTFAICASGTVSVELSILNTPAIVCYKMSPITYRLIRLISKLKFVSLINIVNDKEILPELLQNNLTNNNLYKLSQDFLNKDYNKAKKQEIKQGLKQFKKGITNPSITAGKAIVKYLK